jgi:uncharacterized protein (DUF697 family)
MEEASKGRLRRTLSSVEERVGEVRRLATWTTSVAGLRKAISLRDLRTGHWFDKLIVYYLQHRARTRGGHPIKALAPVADEERLPRAETIIRRAIVQAALMGSGAASLTTGAAVVTADTEGVAGVVALPLAAATMAGEMILRALVQLEMVCELGELYGVTFTDEDAGALGRLLALAFGTEQHQEADDPGRELVVRVARLSGHEAGGAVGSLLVGETLLRDVVPFVGIPISALTSWRLTRRLGGLALRSVQYRRALDDAIAAVEEADPDSADLAIEGVWHVFIADGRLVPEETVLLSHLLHRRPEEARAAATERFVSDETGWLARLRSVAEEARGPMLHTLAVAAAVDAQLPESERSLLRRAAAALHQAASEERLDALATRFRETGVIPAPPAPPPRRAARRRHEEHPRQ